MSSTRHTISPDWSSGKAALPIHKYDGGRSQIFPKWNRRQAQKMIAQIMKQRAAFFHKPNHKYATPKSGSSARLATISSQTTAIGSINGMKSIERHVSDHIAFASESWVGSMMRLPSNEIQNQPRMASEQGASGACQSTPK
jgi:hypothetical protein